MIEDLKNTSTIDKKPVCIKRKVTVSADNKGKEKRRQNEADYMQVCDLNYKIFRKKQNKLKRKYKKQEKGNRNTNLEW